MSGMLEAFISASFMVAVMCFFSSAISGARSKKNAVTKKEGRDKKEDNNHKEEDGAQEEEDGHQEEGHKGGQEIDARVLDLVA